MITTSYQLFSVLAGWIHSPPLYSPQNTSWSPQGMRVLRRCTVPWAEVLFVTIQRENICPSRKEMNKAVTMLLNCPMFAVRLWITKSPYRWPIGSLLSTCMLCTPPHCTKDVYTPQGSTRDVWTVPYFVNIHFNIVFQVASSFHVIRRKSCIHWPALQRVVVLTTCFTHPIPLHSISIPSHNYD
jgi:hypothetical protein